MKESQRCSEEATDEGSDSNSDCDQDSDASFTPTNDTDEEIDTDEIEEDWIEDMKRSTAAAVDQMRTAKNPCWIETHKKNEMEISNANSSITSRKMVQDSSGMEPLTSAQNTNRAVGRPRKKMERRNQ